MKKTSKGQASRFRQEMCLQLEKLKGCCLKSGHCDLLFGGTPVEFYKKCGKAGCRCEQGGESRHGPYRGIQLWRDGKQKHISLRRDEWRYYEMAQHYQYQQANRAKIVELQEELLVLVDRMIEARTIWNKK